MRTLWGQLGKKSRKSENELETLKTEFAKKYEYSDPSTHYPENREVYSKLIEQGKAKEARIYGEVYGGKSKTKRRQTYP